MFNILIAGEEAETFAQKLLEIEGISLAEEDEIIVVYKSAKAKDLIILTAASLSILQNSIGLGKEAINLYNDLRVQNKLEVTIENPEEKTFVEFCELLSP